MSDEHIRTISNKLGNLLLESIPGERVPDLTKTILDYARQLVGSGKPPTDLNNLISKPYTKGSCEMFKTHALGIHTQILSKKYTESWEILVSDHNNMYYDLVQTNDYPPAEGKKPTNKEDALIQGMYTQMDTNFSKLEQSLGTKLINAVKNHNKPNINNRNISEKCSNDKSTDWRHIMPKPGELYTKVVEGVTYK